MQRLIILLVGLLLFALLGYVCVYKKAPEIQDKIQNTVSSTLQSDGIDSVQVYTDGRDITLNGSVDSPELRAKAEKLSQQNGVRLVNNQIEINSPKLAANYFLNIKKNTKNEIILKGFVPDQQIQQDLVSHAMEVFPNPFTVIDLLKLRSDYPEDWTVITKIGIKALQDVESGEMELTHRKITFTGKVDSESTKNTLVMHLTDQLPSGFQKVVNITVVPTATAPESTTTPIVKGEDEFSQAADEVKPEQKPDTQRQCQQEFNQALSSENILFRTGSKELDPSGYLLLEKIVTIAKDCHGQQLYIKGYTDALGSQTVNKRLSNERAYSVKKYLVSKGISADRIFSEGYGSLNPIADNNTEEGRRLNRRIEIVVRGAVQ